jgi:hypothetical protein
VKVTAGLKRPWPTRKRTRPLKARTQKFPVYKTSSLRPGGTAFATIKTQTFPSVNKLHVELKIRSCGSFLSNCRPKLRAASSSIKSASSSICWKRIISGWSTRTRGGRGTGWTCRNPSRDSWVCRWSTPCSTSASNSTPQIRASSRRSSRGTCSASK